MHTLHEYENLRYLLACAQQFDDVWIARELYKRLLRAYLTRDESDSTRGAQKEFAYIKLFHMYLPSNVTSKSHSLKIVLIRLCAILFLLVNACHVCTRF